MEEHSSTFLDYTTLSGSNTRINSSTSRPNAIALQHISSQHYCLVDQYYCLVDQIWYSWTNGMHTKIHCSTFCRVWHTLTASKLSVTILRRCTHLVKCGMSFNLVHIHPLYVFVSVVGSFWSCACLLLFFSLLFCLPCCGLTLFGS